jgi:protein phosphatase
MALTVEVAGKTDVGCVRKNNEDNFGYDARRGMFIVCDGMGGAAAGEVASKLAVDTVMTYFRDVDIKRAGSVFTDNIDGNLSVRGQALMQSIRMANAAIHEKGSNSMTQRGMGSTIVAVAVEGNFLSIAHVGDSRIYLIRQGEITQLTEDHSLVMEQVRRGLITREQAEKSEMQNIIIRALGSEESVEPDVEDLIALPGDVYVLCSDGLSKHVKDDWMLGIVLEAPTLQQATQDLIDAAKAHGGDDNITCVMLRMADQPWYKRFLPGGRPKWQNSF